MYILCYLGLLFVSSCQQLHDYNVGFGHFQYTIHLQLIMNWLWIMKSHRESKSWYKTNHWTYILRANRAWVIFSETDWYIWLNLFSVNENQTSNTEWVHQSWCYISVSWPQGPGWARFLGWAWPVGSVCWRPGRDQQSLAEDCISSDLTSPGEGKHGRVGVSRSTGLQVRPKDSKGKEEIWQGTTGELKEVWKVGPAPVPWTGCSAQVEVWLRCWKGRSDAHSEPARCPTQTEAYAPSHPYPKLP